MEDRTRAWKIGMSTNMWGWDVGSQNQGHRVEAGGTFLYKQYTT